MLCILTFSQFMLRFCIGYIIIFVIVIIMDIIKNRKIKG
jgi:hypothetical protein